MARHITFKDSNKEIRLFRNRSTIGLILIIGLTILLIVRLAYLQVSQHNLYTTLSERNQLNLEPIEPNRGLIYDRNGVLLAENIPIYSLDIIPDRVSRLEEIIDKLKVIIPISDDDLKEFRKQYGRSRRSEPIPIRNKLTEKEVALFSVKQYQFPGVIVNARLMRHYPLGPAVAHALGYVGRINEAELSEVDPATYGITNHIGKVGIEKFYEDKLHGTPGYQQVETDASGRIVRILKRVSPMPGENLYLSLDTNLQIVAERAFENQRGALVAINPKNGQVLALISMPSYDPNLFVNGISNRDFQRLQNSPNQPLFNRAIRGQYAPASTLKPFLAFEGLRNGFISPNAEIYDPGWYRIKNTTHLYRDWRKLGHGWVNLSKAISESCDTYFYTLANKMGINHIEHVMREFGFGDKTGIDLTEERPGLVPSPEWKQHAKHAVWYMGDTIVAGIGQGYILTTPLQLSYATTIMANHGKRIRPTLLYKHGLPDDLTGDEPGTLTPVEAQENQWNSIISAMRRVISSGTGTGGRFGRNPPYSVAAKTGTSQLFQIKQGKEYDQKMTPERLRDNSLFIAFAPINDPQIAVAVLVENSHNAPRVARRVMDFYLAKHHGLNRHRHHYEALA